MENIFKIVQYLNIKTIYFNFKYFSFKDALKFRVIVSNNVLLKCCKGYVLLDGDMKFASVKIGCGDISIFDKKRSKAIWHNLGTIEFGGKCNIGHGCKISVNKNGFLKIGSNFNVTAETSIITSKKISIGNNCLFSWDVLLMDTDFHKIKKNNIIVNCDKEIIIGNNVWIGCRSTILKGTKIPDNTVIAANTVLAKNIITTSHFGGSIFCSNNESHEIRKDINWFL